MAAYRALVEGRNFLLKVEGKTRRHGFYQTVFVDVSDPSEAESAAIQIVRNDPELKQLTENSQDDPPILFLDSLYELSTSEAVPPARGRTYYVEKKWWQFWL